MCNGCGVLRIEVGAWGRARSLKDTRTSTALVGGVGQTREITSRRGGKIGSVEEGGSSPPGRRPRTSNLGIAFRTRRSRSVVILRSSSVLGRRGSRGGSDRRTQRSMGTWSDAIVVTSKREKAAMRPSRETFDRAISRRAGARRRRRARRSRCGRGRAAWRRERARRRWRARRGCRRGSRARCRRGPR